ncbi:MAG: DUF1501 domain-containing protein [Planctomycetota bacterium]|nr:MAG: DUF1501 domain-containing protein [Planctomycetota bacterium]
MNPIVQHKFLETRRHLLGSMAGGIGGLALERLLEGSPFLKAATADGSPSAANNPLSERRPHFAPKAKRMIVIHLTGSPPHLDLYDHKPQLVKRDGEACPAETIAGKTFAFTSGTPKLLGTRRTWKHCGQSGMELSDAIPNLHRVADKLCLIKSMFTDQFNHAPAELMVYTGSPRSGRPSMGSWVTYGLGSENENLPGFVALISSGVQPNGGTSSFGSGFLPSVYQGVQCRSKGDPVLYVSDPPGMSRQMRRKSLDALNDLNELQSQELGNPETLTRIAQYELAYRMQISVPDVMDISRETASVLNAYGAQPGQASLAHNCLLARRLIEQGVRFVHLFDWGWDFHGTNPSEDIRDGLTQKAATFDKPAAALIEDLEQRGLLEDTLILCTGEFGRTPFREGRTAAGNVLGRDHFPDCYSLWMAGGGVKGGLVYGESDDLGFKAARDQVHIHDLQATILHLLGFDHTKLTCRFQGRDFRLTDVYGHVVKALIT